MPNWCNNTITIQGSTETLKTLWEEAQTALRCEDADGNTVEEFGLLSAMRPMPRELEGTISPSPDGSECWYSWRVNNWGTKWDIGNDGLEFEDNGDGTSSITVKASGSAIITSPREAKLAITPAIVGFVNIEI